ncbi:DUF481 domain-containing protein [Foetidibacter luteolus]|uniref:DUF481 domain-containing protein n=1 Tax=Foetidibacter luteolus TaxID=2608880 RepID=UPI001A9963F8|nr:DUF481 domain-containing protein [Foetidibacter luteolus]
MNRTNEQSSFVINNSLGFGVSHRHTAFSSSANWIYGQQNKNLTNNDLLVTANLDVWRKESRISYWALLSYQTSLSLKIDYRLQGGGGISYTILRTPVSSFVISDGLLFEKGNLVDATLGKDMYQTTRNSTRIKYRFNIQERLIVEGIHFYQPSLQDISDYNISSVNTLAVKLRKWLSLTAAANYNKISRTNRENLILTFGVAVEKYF